MTAYPLHLRPFWLAGFVIGLFLPPLPKQVDGMQMLDRRVLEMVKRQL